MGVEDALDRLDPREARHLDVHQHDVRLEGGGCLDGRLAVRRRPDDVQLMSGEQPGEPFAEEIVVVDDEDAYPLVSSLRRRRRRDPSRHAPVPRPQGAFIERSSCGRSAPVLTRRLWIVNRVRLWIVIRTERDLSDFWLLIRRIVRVSYGEIGRDMPGSPVENTTLVSPSSARRPPGESQEGNVRGDSGVAR